MLAGPRDFHTQSAEHQHLGAATSQRGPRDTSQPPHPPGHHPGATDWARGRPRQGGSTHLVVQIHHEWVLVGRVSGRVQHSWRCAGESVGTGLIYGDVRLLGEGRVQLGLILAQQGCQRAVASSPLTSGRGAAGPRRERNRAGVTPGPGGARPLPGSRG